jgi:hypothetical protein
MSDRKLKKNEILILYIERVQIILIIKKKKQNCIATKMQK